MWCSWFLPSPKINRTRRDFLSFSFSMLSSMLKPTINERYYWLIPCSRRQCSHVFTRVSKCGPCTLIWRKASEHSMYGFFLPYLIIKCFVSCCFLVFYPLQMLFLFTVHFQSHVLQWPLDDTYISSFILYFTVTSHWVVFTFHCTVLA